MISITTVLPDEMVASLDAAAVRLRRSRTDIVRQAIENYLEDLEDAAYATAVLHDPTDILMDWDQVKRDLCHLD